MMKVSNQVGLFFREKAVTIEDIISKKDILVQDNDPAEFLDDVYNNHTSFDDLVIVSYDYREAGKGGIGSVYISLMITEEDGKFEYQYAVFNEYSGNVYEEGRVDIGDEIYLLDVLHETLIDCTKVFFLKKYNLEDKAKDFELVTLATSADRNNDGVALDEGQSLYLVPKGIKEQVHSVFWDFTHTGITYFDKDKNVLLKTVGDGYADLTTPEAFCLN